MAREHGNAMTCEEAQAISFLYMKGDPCLMDRQREEFMAHLLMCSACAAHYEGNKRLMELLRHCPVCEDTESLLWAAGYDAGGHDVTPADIQRYRPMTVEESWADLKQRCPSLAGACRHYERKQNVHRIMGRIGIVAVAASILVVMGVWFMVRHCESARSSQNLANHAAEVGSTAVFAELISVDGHKLMGLNQPLRSGEQPKEILLGGMHRVVMNSRTEATFSVEPRLTEGPYAGQVPYAIQLAQGELYVEVVPGKAFTVVTPNARLDITGTKFDVRTDGEETGLTLLKGSVRFSSLAHRSEAVNVTAGHVSTIAGTEAPNIPVPTNVAEICAWARPTELHDAVSSGIDSVAAELVNVAEDCRPQLNPTALEALDYVTWRDAHAAPHEAYARLAEILGAQGIETDWIELMMVSGDIWQFHYDPELPADQSQVLVETPAVERLARWYSLSEQQLLEYIGLPSPVLAAASCNEGKMLGQQYAEALSHWHDAILAVSIGRLEASDNLKLFSFYASQYLAETRTAAYLWAKNNPEKARKLLTDKEYLGILPAPSALMIKDLSDVNGWVDMVRREATVARDCISAALEWMLASSVANCAYQARMPQSRLVELTYELLQLDRAENKNSGQANR